jgi:hypothetical protein
MKTTIKYDQEISNKRNDFNTDSLVLLLTSSVQFKVFFQLLYNFDFHSNYFFFFFEILNIAKKCTKYNKNNNQRTFWRFFLDPGNFWLDDRFQSILKFSNSINQLITNKSKKISNKSASIIPALRVLPVNFYFFKSICSFFFALKLFQPINIF